MRKISRRSFLTVSAAAAAAGVLAACGGSSLSSPAASAPAPPSAAAAPAPDTAPPQLVLGRRALSPRALQVDELGVARKGRTALVGAVPIAGGAQGQDLPDGLARRRKEIHEPDGLRPKAADPIRAGQAGDRH